MSPPDDHDHLIVAIAETRDREAFASLFRHFAPRLKSYLMKSGASDAAAEEFAQEAMLTVWRKADLFDARRARASTWIFTIARNRRLDALRRDGRSLEPVFEISPDGPERPDEVFEGVETARQIREAMAGLPAEQAEAVREAFFHDRPHSEIADRLGLPLGTVKSRIRKAMMKLRVVLEADADEDRP